MVLGAASVLVEDHEVVTPGKAAGSFTMAVLHLHQVACAAVAIAHQRERLGCGSGLHWRCGVACEIYPRQAHSAIRLPEEVAAYFCAFAAVVLSVLRCKDLLVVQLVVTPHTIVDAGDA